MIYADYDYYRNEYLGNSIQEQEFQRLALHASQYIDYITRGKARTSVEEVKMCCCALAEQYQAIDAAKQAQAESLSDEYVELQSETIQSWSRSYGNTADMAAKISADAKASLYEIARQHLSRTGLLYCGGGRPCCG